MLIIIKLGEIESKFEYRLTGFLLDLESSGKCDMPITNAVDAGWPGISEKACLAKGMCWRKWNGPWCYRPYGKL